MPSRLRDSEKYAVLAAVYGDMISGTKVDHRDVGGYRTKLVQAGEYLYVSCYPLIGINADRIQRKRLEELEGEDIKKAKIRIRHSRYNNKRRMLEMEQTVHANFAGGDFHITCTYETQDPNRPDLFEYIDRAQAMRDIRNYLRRVKHLLKKQGCDLSKFRWICCTVTKQGNPEAMVPLPDRHHHHLLVHGIPEELRNDVERLWKFGYCNADRLQDSDTGFARVANYIARQESSFNGENDGRRSFSCSKNIIRPTVKTSDSALSRRRAALIAADIRYAGAEIFEKIYKGYRLVEEAKVVTSTFVAGAYIYAKLRKRALPSSAAGNKSRRCRI